MDKIGIKATLYDLMVYGLSGFVMVVFSFYYLGILTFQIGEPLRNFHLTVSEAVVLILFSYIFGYFVSSFSSFLFENRLIFGFVKKSLSGFYNFDMSRYDVKAREIFGVSNYNEINHRSAMSFCQKNTPDVYSTAFSFLVIYGLSRNISSVLVLFLPFFISKFGCGYWIAYYLFFAFFMIHNYFRFRVNYVHQIASSLDIWVQEDLSASPAIRVFFEKK